MALPVLLVAGAVMLVAAGPATSEPQVIRTYNARDIVITLLGPNATWTAGDNPVILEFDSATRKRLIDVGTPTLMASLPVPGGRPMLAVARLSRGDATGRYVGVITLPRPGDWSVTVRWSGPAQPASATFIVPARSARP